MASYIDEVEYVISRIKQFPDSCTGSPSNPVTVEQLASWKIVPETRSRTVDLAIAGGGLSGFAAAISASRRGLSVIVVEPTHMIGGQATAAGVSAFDITFFYDKMLHDYGLWGEVIRRIQDVYDNELRLPINVGHYRNTSIMPNVVVVERVLSEMLQEQEVEVLRNTSILGVAQGKGRVCGLKTSAGPVHARYSVDATEDGLLLSLAGIPHRLSNGVTNGTTEKGLTSPTRAIQDITYTAIIREYADGIPVELKVQTKPVGYEKYAKTFKKVFPGPGVYDKHIQKIGPLGFAGYRAAPDFATGNMQTGAEYQDVTRTCLNYYNDLTTRAEYLTDSEYRSKFEATAKLKTISLIYYLQNEIGLNWSVATDEGFADGPKLPLNPHVPDVYKSIEMHMPLIPYIRESRRLIGLSTVTAKTIHRRKKRSEAEWRADSVAVGTYHPDLHGGRLANDLESRLGETLDDKPKGWVEGPFPIQLGSLIPEWTDGFIAGEKNISCSRIAAGAIRLHPTVVAIGEAAGVLAALAFWNGSEPRDVPVGAVQAELARGGALISMLEVQGIDRNHPSFAATTLAIAKDQVKWSVLRPHAGEPIIKTDLGEANAKGAKTIGYLQPWLDKLKYLPR